MRQKISYEADAKIRKETNINANTFDMSANFQKMDIFGFAFVTEFNNLFFATNIFAVIVVSALIFGRFQIFDGKLIMS